MSFSKKSRYRKPTKTISGVTPLAVMLKPYKCPHGSCLYCPELDLPKSYVPLSPVVMRASKVNYNPYEQVKVRLKAFQAMKHPTDKIELIIMGGTFLAYPLRYQYEFIKDCYDALNNKKSKNLEEAKRINETSKHRCIALCIETRPDYCNKKEINRLLKFGATRCELGVQLPDNKIYKIVKRGHKVKDVIKATQLLKDSGFKVGYHLMPGLPGSNLKHDFNMFNEIFSNENFKPDQIKIYPTQVLVGSELVKLYAQNKYSPYTEKELVELIIRIKGAVPEYCRIMRIMREIPMDYVVAGTKRIDLRNVINLVLKRRGLKCKCLRCREIGLSLNKFKKIDLDIKLRTLEYKASRGKEIFLSFVNSQDILFALCRLRIPYKPFKKEINKKTLILRELHVFGPQVKIGKKSSEKWQHTGLGKLLLKEAEKIAKGNKLNKIAIISGVGVREYYRNLGYKLEGNYVVKYL